MEWRLRQVWQAVDLCEKAGRSLHRILRSSVASRESSGTEMRDAIEAIFQVAQEELATPDVAVIAKAGAVKADTNHFLLPLSAFGKNRRQMRSMMLNRMPLQNRERGGMSSGEVLRMRIVHQEEIVGRDVIHRDQVLNGFRESLEGLVV